MSVDSNGGSTPFEWLRGHYDEIDLTCPSCGHVDESGHWIAGLSGGAVRYEHVCPECGATTTRELRITE